ncbi:hypothetical protein TIFTF001_017155 [Ficus carica]|uniref:non-specific serine/threonine protein kinase n=1 Tax=Ficus carica TaxID=3494 RepID=A0AA88D6R2_FICCA|nr:hypothetical protein TIFTF001_017155 [Ficus carica]
MSRQTPSLHFHKSKTLDNKYILGDEIGKGAYGRVYKGLDLDKADFVAIKQVSLENIAQEDLNIIMQEIDLLKNLNHKNIVKYLGSLKTKTHLHIILEYVENGSLANIIKPNKFGPFPESLVAVYISQVLEGLGLVKLADFGVATKLTEADVNTHSVVGTPYWMAPEVIEMSGVCAASDIWSVGCTVIELLTCVPPYYDLQPMPALFRIVQRCCILYGNADNFSSSPKFPPLPPPLSPSLFSTLFQDDHPPIPDSLSPDITDFLRQCFKKDARQRPDAKTLLSHPWIQNCRRALQSSIRHSGTLRNIQEDDSTDAEISNGDHQSSGGSPSVEKMEMVASGMKNDSRKELSSTEVVDMTRSGQRPASDLDLVDERTENLEDDLSDQVPTLAIHEKSSLQDVAGRVFSDKEGTTSDQAGRLEPPQPSNRDEVLVNGAVGSPASRMKNGGKVVEIAVEAAKPDAEAKGGSRNPETEEKGAGETLYKFQ